MSKKKYQMCVIYHKEKKGTEVIFEKIVIENFSQINGRQKTTDLKSSENTKLDKYPNKNTHICTPHTHTHTHTNGVSY